MDKSSSILPWQKASWEAIEKLLSTDKLPQALLLYGMEGLGKSQFAHYLAKSKLCLQNSLAPCEDCRSCHLFQVSTHPDFFHLALMDSNQSIKIQAVREVNSAICKKPQLSPCQIVIIDDADAMTMSAANSLLKILEDPPGNVTFILVSNQLYRLLPTIRSRCSKFSFQSPDREIALEWLEKNNLTKPGTELLEQCLETPLYLKTLVEHDYPSLQKGLVSDLTALCHERSNAISIAAVWQQHPTMMLLDTLFSWVLDVIKLAFIGDSVLLKNETMREILTEWSKNCRQDRLHDYLLKIIKLRALANEKANINLQLSLEVLLLGWPVSSQKRS